MPATKAVDKAPPETLFLHCQTTYKAMLAEAKAVVVPRETDVGFTDYEGEVTENDVVIVWEGMLTSFITGKLNLSVPYYTYIMRALKRMGCVQQLKRGGGTSPSQWRLIKEPVYEDYLEGLPPKTPRPSKDTLQEGINAQVNRRLLRLEKAFDKILEEET
jgi:hypothetical protein